MRYKVLVLRTVAFSLLTVCSVLFPCYGQQEEGANWCDISQKWANPGRSELTYVDLFCGAGGLSLGLEEAGLIGICGLDYFKEAGWTYEKNFKHKYLDGDVTLPETKTNLYRIVKEALGDRHLSLLVGGFPCQGFSMAGNRVVDDPRNSLYREMVEIVRVLAPLLAEEKYVTVEQAIGDLIDRQENESISHIFTQHSPEMVARMDKLAEGEGLYSGYSEARRRCAWEKPSPTVKENHGGVFVHPKLPRVMTPRELARLQSFPDGFIFEGTKSKQFVQIGNAVPVLLGKAIGLSVRYSAGDLQQ